MKKINLLIMAVLSFFVMYTLMYIMIDKLGNIYLNLNQIYMALAMTAIMIFLEIIIMSSMYNKKTKVISISLSAIIFIISITLLRFQVYVSDKDFLRSMISHHGSAIFMCHNFKLKDPEIIKLCKSINSNQQSQIDWMKEKLSSLK